MGNLCGPKEPEKKAPEKKAVKTVPPVKPVKPVRPVRTVRARSAAAAAAAEEVFLIEEVKNQVMRYSFVCNVYLSFAVY